MCKRKSALAVLVALGQGLPAVLAQKSAYPVNSFLFSWDAPGTTFPVPVTTQCESIHIQWGRGSATGPNPVPPYYLQVYTSLFLVPIIIPAGDGLSYDWAVPFPPGTIYQICMFDSNGNTGGCQDKYTIIPAEGIANCANATLPSQLDVEGIVHDGPISRYGWIEQCTDIQIRPKNGTPPYTFTIAPALHPPFNMSGPGPFNWTVDLSWATPFFISVADSAGNAWSNGVLHSGGPGVTSDCLAGNSTTNGGVPAGAAAGAGVGGVVLGLFIGLASMFLFTRKKIKTLEQQALLDLSGDAYAVARLNITQCPHTAASTPWVTSDARPPVGSFQYHIEPFTMPPSTTSDDGRLRPSPPTGTGSGNAEGKVQAPPVTIYHEDGTEVVELPPRYPDGAASPPARSGSEGGSGSGSGGRGGRRFLGSCQQPRRPNQPHKPQRRNPSPQ
ncbi:hypothetical protein FA13DRAFT_1751550 [Coprinellus micaceus]|uniref:Fibronectin type-III domain-containing protein n=1 Tax=Coprinellus micaceus TaxID=71717 RepID=A0A4Y7TY25_COPMI|nr:hypothetical protein FA13DRAFT_1751550 [Coprinellus micaceus]